MPASAANDKFRLATPFFSTTLAVGCTPADTTLNLTSTTNLPTTTACTIIIDEHDSTGAVITPTTKREVIRGEVSGTTLINCVRGVDNTTPQAHSVNAVIEVVPTASDWNDMANALLTSHNQDGSLIGTAVNTALNSAWTAYTPTWTTVGTAPVLGNGALAGNYYKVGRMVTCTIYFTAGSTTTFGTAAWAFSLPVAPKTVTGTHRAVGTSYMEDAGIKGYIGFLRIIRSDDGSYPDKLVVDYSDPSAAGAFGTASVTTPFTWGTGDYFYGTFTYEAAA